ncbi:hypothetical protein AAFC00_001489 [Neodothiora populina]|uniref:RRM domain-containing protein n=1 Tax=Neodothiora populina TaxID=2781224 RepID=A0ABR3PP36_9PEZI
MAPTKNKPKNEKVASSFDAMIQADRKKRKAEELAQQIFGKHRAASAAPGSNKRNATQNVGGSLASRNSSQPRPSPSVANDKRQLQSNRPQGQRNPRKPFNKPNDGATSASASRLKRDPAFASNEISIRGAAGPYCVVASNFAPGTTAADIESVMLPVGGEMLGCKLISANPTVIVEMVFTERSGAENVISMFNNKKADGRILYVYMKEGGPSQPIAHHSTVSNSAVTRPTPIQSLPAPTAPTAPVAFSLPAQQASDEYMEIEPESIVSNNNNDAAYVANGETDFQAEHAMDGGASFAPRGNEAPRAPRETYRPPHRNDYPRGPRRSEHEYQDGRHGYQDQRYARREDNYGGGYRSDNRGRFRDDGRSRGQGNGRSAGGYA